MLIELLDTHSIQTQRVRNVEHREKHKDDPYPYFYPSSVGKCVRFLGYQALGFLEVDFPARVLRIMDNGNYVHERLQKMFGDMGILLALELPLNERADDKRVADLCKKYRISGRLDAIIRLDGEVYVAELKSMNTKKFTKMVNRKTPEDSHYKQVQLYLHLTGIKKGIILVENKDSQELWEYIVEYDQECIDEIMGSIEYLNDCIDKSIIPERQFPRNSFECRFCDANTICWSSRSS